MAELSDPHARRAYLLHEAQFGAPPAVVASAPGRVNLIGEHVDYCGGWVLPMAIPNRTYVTFGVAPGAECRIFSSRLGEISFPIDRPERAGDWADYVRGTVREFVERGLRVPGLVGSITGDVPLGGGLSSSASLDVALATALNALVGGGLEPDAIARLAQAVENRTVGVACGLMDPMAVAVAGAGEALLLDCRTGATEGVPVEFDAASFVLADSRVPRTLAGSKYNERRDETARGLAALVAAGWELRDLRDVPFERLGEAVALLPEPIDRRVRHVVSECQRVREAVAALRAGDAARFGALLDASHQSLRDDFEVSHPDVDELVGLARAVPGVYGARVTGAGFGGFVLVLVSADGRQRLADELVAKYYQPRGRGPSILDAGRGSAAARVDYERGRDRPH